MALDLPVEIAELGVAILVLMTARNESLGVASARRWLGLRPSVPLPWHNYGHDDGVASDRESRVRSCTTEGCGETCSQPVSAGAVNIGDPFAVTTDEPYATSSDALQRPTR